MYLKIADGGGGVVGVDGTADNVLGCLVNFKCCSAASSSPPLAAAFCCLRCVLLVLDAFLTAFCLVVFLRFVNFFAFSLLVF